MNLKTFDKGTRLLKQTDLAIRGQSLQGETNKTVIGILDCTNNGNPAILENLKCGIRQGGGLSLTFNLNNYDFHQRIAPATAKYAYKCYRYQHCCYHPHPNVRRCCSNC